MHVKCPLSVKGRDCVQLTDSVSIEMFMLNRDGNMIQSIYLVKKWPVFEVEFVHDHFTPIIFVKGQMKLDVYHLI